jgi:hypothetical protein
MSDFVRVGDIILAQMGKRIEECEITAISPSGQFIRIDSENWEDQWIRLLDYLETLDPINEVEVNDALVLAQV